jgi:protein-S-isoprenylcysteine O-methyltransferase Ste14
LLLFIGGPSLLGNPYLAAFSGLLIASVGQAIRATAVGLDYIIRGGRKRQVYAERLVQGGLFAHCRNPLYLGNLLIVLGLAVASDSLVFLTIAMPFFTFAYMAIVAAEENYLRGKFGTEFDDYCRRVPRFLPRIQGFRTTLSGMAFDWRRVISAEYGTAFAWFAVLILVLFHRLWMRDELHWDSLRIRALSLGMLFAMFAYSVARYLKKTGRLRAASRSESASPHPKMREIETVDPALD